MYEKDKKTRLTIRLSEEQFQCVLSKAEVLGVSPSEFIRMLVNSLLYAEKNITDKVRADFNQLTEKVGGSSRENDKADIDN